MATFTLNPVVAEVTAAVMERSRYTRAAYLDHCEAASRGGRPRGKLSCANFAHAFAGGVEDAAIQFQTSLRIANLRPVAGGVPAMCDGVTQGRPGMELSLFSRDVIAMATAIALTHDAFDAALMLGICDKIVPGLVIGALSFGHLPVIFVPAGPMNSGASNADKARVRAFYAEGKVGRDELLNSEMASYHGPGTCTFYGTANSNQMMMEMMGLHLPGSAFVNPYTPLRDALTQAAATHVITLTAGKQHATSMARVVDEKAVINAAAGLLATGGSTNHTLHLLAMARAAGVMFTWDDFDRLSTVTPLIARVYPNGAEDVNAFHAAGGMAFVIGELLKAGLVHQDVVTVAGPGLDRYTEEPFLKDGVLAWRKGVLVANTSEILRPVENPFDHHGGIRLMTGNLGRAIAKISAVKPGHRVIEAPAVVFDDQEALAEAFQRGELNRDLVAVVRFQGPRANGMPELHNLTPSLGVLMDRGYKVALVTDGRMSGASGKVPAALHVTPEAADGGMLARLRTGDIIRFDAETGVLDAKVEPSVLMARELAVVVQSQVGFGRELFGHMRAAVSRADAGASVLFWN